MVKLDIKPSHMCHVLQGQGIQGSSVVQGMVFKRAVEGDVTKAENCKVVVYTCPLDLMQTETKVCVCVCVCVCVFTRGNVVVVFVCLCSCVCVCGTKCACFTILS